MHLIHTGVGHQDTIDCLVFSTDGRQLLSGSRDGTAKIWDVHSGALLKTLFWGGSGVNAVAWSPNGATVAVACQRPDVRLSEEELESYQAGSFFDAHHNYPPAEVRIYDSRSGRQLLAIDRCGGGVAFSPDGLSLAVVFTGTVALFDIASGECIAQTRVTGENDFRNVFFSMTGKQVACVASSGVMVFDAATATPIYAATDIPLDSDPVDFDRRFRLIRYSHDAKGEDKDPKHRYEFWQQALSEFRPNNWSHGDMHLQRIAFSNDGRLAAVGNSDDPMRAGISILGLPDGEPLQFVSYPDRERILTTAFSPDSGLLAAAGDQRTIFLWEVDTGREIRRIGLPPPAISAVSFSPSSPVVAAGTADGAVLICRADSPNVVGFAKQLPSPIIHIAFLPDGESLVIAGKDGRVRVCRFPSLQPIIDFRAHRCRLLGGMVSADGKRYISVGYQDEPTYPRGRSKPARILISRLEDGQELAFHELPPIYPITSVAASPNQRQLAISFWESVIAADIGETIEARTILTREQGNILKVAYIPEAPALIVANEGYGMALFGLETALLKRSFVATRDGPTAFAFNSEGTFVVRSTAYFHQLELFDLESGILKAYFVGHQAAVTSLAMSADNTVLASGGIDGTLKLWDVDARDLKASIVTLPDSSNSHQPWEILSVKKQ